MAGQVALNLQALTFNDHPLWELTCRRKKKRECDITESVPKAYNCMRDILWKSIALKAHVTAASLRDF